MPVGVVNCSLSAVASTATVGLKVAALSILRTSASGANAGWRRGIGCWRRIRRNEPETDCGGEPCCGEDWRKWRHCNWCHRTRRWPKRHDVGGCRCIGIARGGGGHRRRYCGLGWQ